MIVKRTNQLERRLREELLAGRRKEGDRLALSDAVLRAALDGARALTAGERTALESSPLTVRRLRQLAIERRGRKAANDDAWQGSGGMLRAADSGSLSRLVTDDGYWILHFSDEEGEWRIVLQLKACAPFTARLLRERPALCVTDGEGKVLLEGRLDGDGECEGAWMAGVDPASYFQQHGARFVVRPQSAG
ncbi:MAG: hypothetical protein ACXWC4_01880 [Telluria sp.]